MSMTYEECLESRAPRSAPNIPSHAMDQFNMKGKVCVISGASRGIGEAIAEAFAEAGAHIINIHHSEDPTLAEKASKLAKRCGVTVVNRQCNVADAAKVEALLADIRTQSGKIDVFVANAGICIAKPILEQTLDEYHAQVDTNLHGVFYCANISGRAVTVPVDHVTYNTTKAAVTHLGRSLAREWRDFARVNIVAPGYIDTDMNTCPASVNEACRMAAMGRMGHAKELKAIYLYLASDASSFVTGAEFTVDGGYTLP